MIVTALLAGLFSGIIGAMGLGGGAVLIMYLSLFTDTAQLKAQGINLLFFIPCALAAVIIYSVKKQIEWKITLKLAFFGLIGAVAGIYLSDYLGGDITRKVFGALLVIMGIKEIFGKGREKTAQKSDKSLK